MRLTEIQNFYKNKTVFITGGTGFFGNILVEKLLRSCSEINQIIVPIRAKKKISFKERIQTYFSDKLFDEVKTKEPNIIKKVIFLSTNLEEANCGLSDADYNFVKSSVNIIFHNAATVEFLTPLSEAVNTNIKITQNIIDLAKEITDLKALVHVSTIASQSVLDYAFEKVHELSYKPEFLYNLIDNLDEATLTKITPILLQNWPNTYVMTKNIAEYLVDAEKDSLPVAIFRPGAVVSTLREPFPGWMNTFQASIGLPIYIATGIVKVILANMQHGLYFAPVDLAINCMIAIAWCTATQKEFVKLMNRNKKMLDASAYFLLKEYKFEYKNVPALWNSLHQEDKKLFNFDLDSINWDEYMDIFTKSAKELLKEDFNNMEKAEAKRYLLRCKY